MPPADDSPLLRQGRNDSARGRIGTRRGTMIYGHRGTTVTDEAHLSLQMRQRQIFGEGNA